MNELDTNDALPDKDHFEDDLQVTLRGFLEPKLIKEQFAQALKALSIPENHIRLKPTNHGTWSEPQNINKQGNCIWYTEELPPSAIRELKKYTRTYHEPDENEHGVMEEPKEQLYITLKIPIEIEVQW